MAITVAAKGIVAIVVHLGQAAGVAVIEAEVGENDIGRIVKMTMCQRWDSGEPG